MGCFQFNDFLERYPPVNEDEAAIFEAAEYRVLKNNNWLNTNRDDFEDFFDEN